jgi:hypothetical protein
MSDDPQPARRSFEDLSDLELERASTVATGGRTAIVITAAVVLFAGAVFALLSVVLLAEFSTASISGAAVAFVVAYGILEAVTGVLVLLLVPAGRWLGMFLGIAGIVLGGVLASSAPTSGLVSILLNAFVIYALASSGPSFRRG